MGGWGNTLNFDLKKNERYILQVKGRGVGAGVQKTKFDEKFQGLKTTDQFVYKSLS